MGKQKKSKETLSVSLPPKTLEVLMVLLPAMQEVFRIGFIPRLSDLIELDEELYAKYVAETGSKERPIYYVELPSEDFQQEEEGKPVLHLVNEEGKQSMIHAIRYFQCYAKEHGLSLAQHRQVLTHAAENIPHEITKDTSYEQPNTATDEENQLALLHFVSELSHENFNANVKLGDGETLIVTSEGVHKTHFDVDSLKDFEQVKDKLIIRPIKYHEHKQQLKDFVYERFWDIALVLYIHINSTDEGNASAKIPVSMVNQWPVSHEEALAHAKANTLETFEPYIVPGEFFLTGKQAEDYPARYKFFLRPGFKHQPTIMNSYNLFLKDSMNGATLPFLSGTLAKLGQALNDDLYVVLFEHNFAVIHLASKWKLPEVKASVKREKTNPYGNPSEHLSNQVYLYSRDTDTFDIVR